MKSKLIGLIVLLIFSTSLINAQKSKSFELKSPDGSITLLVETGAKLQWSVQHKGQQIISPSAISLQLEGGVVLGDNAKIRSSKTAKIDSEITAINYIKSIIPDQYNQLTLNCKDDFGVVFRVYDEGVAYQFFTTKKSNIIISNEEANFNFFDDYEAFIPYLWDFRDGKKFNASFESLYDEVKISEIVQDSLVFLPLLVDVGNGKKVAILEADLEDYPGMFLTLNKTGKGFQGVYAPYPLEAEIGGGGRNYIPTKRADYIAKTVGTRNFPWRAIVISESDKELLDIDIVQKLASPSRIEDISWIEPGHVAWDWWNARNISHVDFKAGMNTETYKYFIDFASANNIKYILLDGGWTDAADLTKIRPSLDIKEIIKYGNEKNVGVIVWALWHTVVLQMDEVFPLFAELGIKGLKIDFIDRDDQIAVASTYEIAKKAAEHNLLVDYHGSFKPTGLQRTYPNVVGYEGVKGLENYKWATENQPRYTVTIPFIRMMAGPMDYTPGAMRNSNRENYRPINDNPMSQGTRCHQLAMYVIHEVPLQMLADNPTIYMKEQECTDFITSVPTVYDETVALDGKVGEYVALARKKGDIWFAGAMTNWTSRELILDFSFLDDGKYKATIFKDGLNADRDGTDYKKEMIIISSGDKLSFQLAPGGGWAARIVKLQ